MSSSSLGLRIHRRLLCSFGTHFQMDAFNNIYSLTRMTLNHKKRFWVQYGVEECDVLLVGVATPCFEFRDKHVCVWTGWR